jgi:hypothetical protein
VKCFDCLDWMYHLAEPLYLYYRREGSICNRPETGPEYLAWASDLSARIERGDSLDLRNGAARALFHRFLRGRHLIEAAFVEELENGRCTDFHEFIRHRRELFDRLVA